MELRDRIRDALAEELAGQEALYCTRVWDAWDYGTMTEDDFSLVSEDEAALDVLVHAVLRAIEGE